MGAATFSPGSPITLGGSVTVSVGVTGPGGVTAPTGNVQFQVSVNGGSYANFGSPTALSGSSASDFRTILQLQLLIILRLCTKATAIMFRHYWLCFSNLDC